MNIQLVSLELDFDKDYDPIFFPLGLSCIAPILIECGLNVTFFDLNKTIHLEKRVYNDFLEDLAEDLLNSELDYMGFYTRSDLLPRVLLCAEKVKNKCPNIQIILGGPGTFSVESEILENFPFIDIIVMGEGELTMKELFCSGKLSDDLSLINGIAYKKNKKVIINPERELVEDLDSLPYPIRFTEIDKAYIQNNVPIGIEAGRGCPYDCSFCSTSPFWKRKYRVKSPKRLLDEVEILYNKGYTYFTFIHDNLLVSEKYVLELADEFRKRQFKISWLCSARIDNINELIVSSVKECGCDSIYFGVETGSSRMQKIMGKNIKIEDIDNVLAICDKYKIKSTKSFIVGFEEETLNDINDTLYVAIKTANCKWNGLVQLHYLMPTPGTRVAANRRNRLILDQRQISGISYKRGSKYFDEKETLLIGRFQSIFLNFYKIECTLPVDLYDVSFCFAHWLYYYPKTMQILCIEHKRTPLDLYDKIRKNCSDCGQCVENAITSTIGGNGICTNPLLYLSDIELSAMDKFVINYEMIRRNKLVEVEINNYNIFYEEEILL